MEVPKLRFKEFDSPWEQVEVGKIGEFFGGGTPDTNVEEFWSGDIPWISSSDILDNDINRVNITRFISQDAIKKSATKLIPKDSVLIVSRVGVGKFAVAPTDVTTSQDFTNLVLNKNLFNNSFFAYNLYQNRNLLHQIAQGTSIKGFTTVDLKKVKLKKTSLSEQQKIADFLQKADERIALLKEKKELLERYKKGVMRQIFSQKLKFKKGSKWNEIKVHEIYRNIPTNSLSRNDLNYNYGTVKNIHYGDIHTSFKSHLNTTYEKIPYINQEIKLRYTSSSYCTPGDIIFADASEDVKDIGKCVEIIEVNNDHLLAGLHTIHFRPITQLIAEGFAGYLFRSPNVVRQIQKESQGAKVLGISTSKLLNLSVVIPEIHEQEMIVDFLTKLDEKIYAIEKQLKLAELWKKGLLQQMFV